jgi:hypothetical protein
MEKLTVQLATKAVIAILALALSGISLRAQDEGDDSSKANTNLGLAISAPLNPTGQFVDLGLGTNIGAGYNFTRRHAVVGEFMWNHLFVSSSALNQIRQALDNPAINSSSNVFAFTGNYRFELRGKALGTYLIGGGGWYYRNAHLSQKVTSGEMITCTPVWLWWGFSCQSGIVTANQTVAGSSSNTLGINGGIGFTVRVGDAPYRVYVESRYHYAPTKGISTQLATITVGIRY